MKQPSDKDPIDVLGRIYETVYEDSVAAFHKAKDKTNTTLHSLIDEAGELLSEAQELSREQINEVSNYVKRDINDAAHFLSVTGNELNEWLGFELKMLESKVVEELLDAADPSTLDLLKFKQKTEEITAFHTGQVAGAGLLSCDACGKELHYYKAGRIPPCPKCHKTLFHRVVK